MISRLWERRGRVGICWLVKGFLADGVLVSPLPASRPFLMVRLDALAGLVALGHCRTMSSRCTGDRKDGSEAGRR